MSFLVLLRGGGDVASGAAIRLKRVGLQVVITELPHPMAVRRLVAFAEAVYSGTVTVEEVKARRVSSPEEALDAAAEDFIPVLVDPQADSRLILKPAVLIDGRMAKRPPDLGIQAASMVIGLGPGFTAGLDCHAVIETNRGHALGRVIWNGPAEPDTGVPESVLNHGVSRVLRSPADGFIEACADIGDILEEGQCIAKISGIPVQATFKGVLRGLLHPGFEVRRGMKIGDVDPRLDASFSRLVSDKALAIGGGVLEAILARPDLRSRLCG